MRFKTIKIGDHYIDIPEPTKREDIINIDLKKDDAYWQRQEDIPKIFYDYNPSTKIYQESTLYDQDEILISLSEEDSRLVAHYLQRELHRRTYGVHMKNGENIIWLNPDYYFNLQWGPMIGLAEKWGQYRHFQNDFCIKRGWGRSNPNIAGMFTTKPKKTGISQIMAGCYANRGTLVEKKQLLMMSKSGPDVHDVCLDFFFYIYDELPYIMKPRLKKRNLSEIIFGMPPARAGTTKSNQLETYRGRKIKALNTRVAGVPTKESGFDGPKVDSGWVDEYPKTWEGSNISPDAIYKKTIESVKLQQEIIGWLDYTSYVPEIDDRGFRESKEVWNKSKIIVPSTGRTESEMIIHFISVLDSMQGHFDKYGYCDRRKTLHVINVTLAAKSESSEKQRVKRQYPVNEQDAWGAGGLGSTFDNIRLADIYNAVEAEVLSGVLPYKLGKYEWADKKLEVFRAPGVFSAVEFIPMTDDEILIAGRDGAKFKFFQDIPERLKNQVIINNIRHEDDNRLCPSRDCIFVTSFDPTDYKLKKEVQQGSKNASHTMSLYDLTVDTEMGCPATNRLHTEYLFRPDHPDEAYEDLVKQIIYFGSYGIIEDNKPWVVTKMITDGLQHFLLLRKSDGTIGPYKPGDEQHTINTTANLIEHYCRKIALYIAKPRQDGSVDYGMLMKTLKLIQQLMDFDPTNTKIYDLVVSLGYVLLGIDAFSVFRQEWLNANGTYDGAAMAAAMAELEIG